MGSQGCPSHHRVCFNRRQTPGPRPIPCVTQGGQCHRYRCPIGLSAMGSQGCPSRHRVCCNSRQTPGCAAIVDRHLGLDRSCASLKEANVIALDVLMVFHTPDLLDVPVTTQGAVSGCLHASHKAGSVTTNDVLGH